MWLVQQHFVGLLGREKANNKIQNDTKKKIFSHQKCWLELIEEILFREKRNAFCEKKMFMFLFEIEKKDQLNRMCVVVVAVSCNCSSSSR